MVFFKFHGYEFNVSTNNTPLITATSLLPLKSDYNCETPSLPLPNVPNVVKSNYVRANMKRDILVPFLLH